MAAKPDAKVKTTEKTAKAAPAKVTAKAPVEKEQKKTAKAAASTESTTVKSERGKAKEEKVTHHHASQLPREEMKCEVKGCKREYRAKGYCKPHYRKWRNGEYGHRRFTACSSNSCNKPMAMNRHGYCEEHYTSYYIKGMAVAKAAVEEKPAAAPAKVAASA